MYGNNRGQSNSCINHAKPQRRLPLHPPSPAPHQRRNSAAMPLRGVLNETAGWSKRAPSPRYCDGAAQRGKRCRSDLPEWGTRYHFERLRLCAWRRTGTLALDLASGEAPKPAAVNATAPGSRIQHPQLCSHHTRSRLWALQRLTYPRQHEGYERADRGAQQLRHGLQARHSQRGQKRQQNAQRTQAAGSQGGCEDGEAAAEKRLLSPNASRQSMTGDAMRGWQVEVPVRSAQGRGKRGKRRRHPDRERRRRWNEGRCASETRI
jgi:hypothetical protein